MNAKAAKSVVGFGMSTVQKKFVENKLSAKVAFMGCVVPYRRNQARLVVNYPRFKNANHRKRVDVAMHNAVNVLMDAMVNYRREASEKKK
jgi:hypothetical protein